MARPVQIFTTHIQPTRAVQDRHRDLRQILDILRGSAVIFDVAADEEAKFVWQRAIGGRAAPASARELPCAVGLNGIPFSIEQLQTAHDEGRLHDVLGLEATPRPIVSAPDAPPLPLASAFKPTPREPYRPSLDLDGASITSSQADQVLDDLFAGVEGSPQLGGPDPVQTTPRAAKRHSIPITAPQSIRSAVVQIPTPPATPSPATPIARIPARAPSPVTPAMETLPDTPPMTPDLSFSPSTATSATMSPHSSVVPTVRSSLSGDEKAERSLSSQYAFLNFEPDSVAGVDLRSFLDGTPATPGAIAEARRKSVFCEAQAQLEPSHSSPVGGATWQSRSYEDVSGLAEDQPVAPLFSGRDKPLPSPTTPREAVIRPRTAAAPSKRSVERPASPITPKRSRGLFSCCSGSSYYDDA